MRTITVCVGMLIGLIAVGSALRTSVSPASESPRVYRVAEMSVERAAHQATLLQDGRVLVTGGCGRQGCAPFHRSAEAYDPAAGAFRSVASMAIPRVSHTATLLRDGRVLVAGGCSGAGVTARAEVYDVEADRWSPVGDMTEPRCSHIAVPLSDGRVFIMGGGDGRLANRTSAEVFDPATATFSAVGSMGASHYLATRLADGRVLLTGGQDDRGEILRSARIFDPTTGRSHPTGDMSTPRVKHAAALLPDGRVMIIGGSDHRGYPTLFASTEIYDPGTGRFSPGPEMRWGRHKIRDAVAVLPSGAVIVAGGAARPELYDPADRVFVPVRGELSGPQMFATATLLPAGELLVVGGYDDRTRSSASAWMIAHGVARQGPPDGTRVRAGAAVGRGARGALPRRSKEFR